MPVTDRTKLKSGGFAQVRAALQAFEGDCIRAGFDKYGGERLDSEGNPLPASEFLEIETINNVVTEVTEDLSMDISPRWSFRIKTSEATNTVWDRFLESADKFKLLIPEGLIGKRISWRKITIEGSEPKYTASTFIIDKVAVKKAALVPKIATKLATKPVVSQTITIPVVEQEEVTPAEDDPMALVCELAVGKTEQQLRSAAGLHPKLIGNPILPLIKAGLATTALVSEGRLVLVDGKYQKP